MSTSFTVEARAGVEPTYTDLQSPGALGAHGAQPGRKLRAARFERFNRALLAAIFPILAACGGGDPELTKCEPTIALFGDSTMAPELGAGPLWIKRWGSRVSNRAVGGTNSTALVAGTDGLNIPWPGSVSAQYAVVAHGLNDGYLPFPRAFTPLPQYVENLRTLASAPGAEVIFQTPLPSFRHDRNMTLYAQAMRDVAAEKGLRVIDVFACFQATPGWQAMLPDEVHPNEAGKARMVECAAPIVESLECR